jgi:hypothetical protein
VAANLIWNANSSPGVLRGIKFVSTYVPACRTQQTVTIESLRVPGARYSESVVEHAPRNNKETIMDARIRMSRGALIVMAISALTPVWAFALAQVITHVPIWK